MAAAAHHLHQREVEEDAGGDAEDPMLHRGLRGDEQADVEAQEGSEGAQEVHQHRRLHRQPGVQQHRKVSWEI